MFETIIVDLSPDRMNEQENGEGSQQKNSEQEHSRGWENSTGQENSEDKQENSEHEGTSRKRQHRWNPSRHIFLLRAVILRSPFSAPYKTKSATWNSVAQDYNAAVKEPNAINGRKAKEKFDILLSTFRRDEVESLRKSGTNEEYTELNTLLEELDELEHDAKVEDEATKESTKKKVSYIKYGIFSHITLFNFILYR
jgi:hypothetical protein